MKLKTFVCLLVLLLVPSLVFAAVPSGAINFSPSGIWASGTGTAKVINFPTKFTGSMVRGTGTITKWGPAAVAVGTAVNPLLSLVVTGGLMVGSYYFDKWLNEREITYDGTAYTQLTTGSVGTYNDGTVTPTIGHVNYYYLSGSVHTFLVGYFHTYTEALNALNASPYKNTTNYTYLSMGTGNYRPSLCSNVYWKVNYLYVRRVSDNQYQEYSFAYPVTGTPYTEGVALPGVTKTVADIIALMQSNLQVSNNLVDAVRDFLQTHEPTINYYLENNTLPASPTLTAPQVDVVKNLLLDNVDNALLTFFDVNDFVGAPTIEENANPYPDQSPEAAPAVNIDGLADDIAANATALNESNVQADQSAKTTAETALTGLTLPELVGAYDIAEAVQPEKTIDNVIDYLIDNSPITSIFQAVDVSSAGACEFTYSYKDKIIKFGVCAFSDFLDMWAILMGSLVSLHCLFILFKRG